MNFNLKQLIDLLEKLFVIISLILFTGAFILLAINERIDNEVYTKYGSLTLVIFFTIYLMLMIFIIIRKKLILDIFLFIKKEKWLSCLIILMFLSTLWSINVYEALKKSFTRDGPNTIWYLFRFKIQ